MNKLGYIINFCLKLGLIQAWKRHHFATKLDLKWMSFYRRIFTFHFSTNILTLFKCLANSSQIAALLTLCLTVSPASTGTDPYTRYAAARCYVLLRYLFSFVDFLTWTMPACFCPLQYLQNMRLFLKTSHGKIFRQLALNVPLAATVDVEVELVHRRFAKVVLSKSEEETLLIEPSKPPSTDSSFSFLLKKKRKKKKNVLHFQRLIFLSLDTWISHLKSSSSRTFPDYFSDWLIGCESSLSFA